jgi:hypothetical protein
MTGSIIKENSTFPNISTSDQLTGITTSMETELLSLPILELITNLETYLTNEDNQQRSIGLNLIAKAIPKQKLSLQTKQVLLEFFIARIDDFECLTSVMQGLLELPVSNIACHKMFQLGVRSLSAQQRNWVFQYIKKLILESNDLDEYFIKGL